MAKKKHPKGLAILFFTEMWERFGYYLMLGIFTLYMVEGTGSNFPGLGMSNADAADIYGTFLAFLYLTPFFGGLLADRVFGYRKSIIAGGVLMAAGYILLAIPGSITAFYVALLLIILGNGLFKPNISVLLGKLYEKPEYEGMKDSGFNIFYMGINIGAFVCNFIAAYLRLTYGWGWAFAAAGVGMLLGIIWFVLGDNLVSELKEADQISAPKEGDVSIKQVLMKLFIPAFAAGILGWFIPGNLLGSDSNDAFVLFCIPLIFFFMNLVKSADKVEKEPIKALLSIFGVVIIFWAVFHQNGSALTYWAKNNTDREMGPVATSVFTTLRSVEEVSTIPREVKVEGLHGEDLGVEVTPSYYFKNYQGEIPTGGVTEKPQDIKDAEWEATVKADRERAGVIKLWPTELQASINPFFVIILTPLVVAFFTFLRNRKKEPTTPGKIALGMFVSAASWLVMVAAAIYSGNGEFKASISWLFGIYGIITIGELCLSPMGLSLVSKLAPKRIAALMMGGWFLSTAIGNKLSGVLSGLWDVFPNKTWFFLTNSILTFIAFGALMLLLPWLNRVYNNHMSK